MDGLLDSIRAAVTPGATDETKAAGALACRTILTALEAKVGEPLESPILTSDNVPATAETLSTTLVDADGTPTSSEPPMPTPQQFAANVAAAVSVLRNVPPEQLLDLAIARLRAALPVDVQVPPVQPLRFHIIQAPKLRGKP